MGRSLLGFPRRERCRDHERTAEFFRPCRFEQRRLPVSLLPAAYSRRGDLRRANVQRLIRQRLAASSPLSTVEASEAVHVDVLAGDVPQAARALPGRWASRCAWPCSLRPAASPRTANNVSCPSASTTTRRSLKPRVDVDVDVDPMSPAWTPCPACPACAYPAHPAYPACGNRCVCQSQRAPGLEYPLRLRRGHSVGPAPGGIRSPELWDGLYRNTALPGFRE